MRLPRRSPLPIPLSKGKRVSVPPFSRRGVLSPDVMRVLGVVGASVDGNRGAKDKGTSQRHGQPVTGGVGSVLSPEVLLALRPQPQQANTHAQGTVRGVSGATHNNDSRRNGAETGVATP